MAKAKSTGIVKTQSASAAMARPLEPWEQEMLAQAKEEVAKETVGMPRISTKGGRLSIDGKPVENNKLKCVIVDYVFSKAFYESEYDEDNPQTPTCYAFGRAEEGMVPHPNSPDKKHDVCTGCPHNAFGTALKGKGKRCKDERRLGVIVEVADPTDVQRAEVRGLTIAPLSFKNWATYLKNSIPEVTPTKNVRAVLTEISTEPAKAVFAVTFRPIDRLEKEFVQAVNSRVESVRSMLMQPYPTLEADAKPEPQPKKKLKGQ